VFDHSENLLSANGVPTRFFECPKCLTPRELMQHQPIYLQKIGLLVKTFDDVVLPNFLEKSTWRLDDHV
jgi:hypothetical protein